MIHRPTVERCEKKDITTININSHILFIVGLVKLDTFSVFKFICSNKI